MTESIGLLYLIELILLIRKKIIWTRGYDEVFIEYYHNPYFNCLSYTPTKSLYRLRSGFCPFPLQAGPQVFPLPPLPHAPVNT